MCQEYKGQVKFDLPTKTGRISRLIKGIYMNSSLDWYQKIRQTLIKVEIGLYIKRTRVHLKLTTCIS